MRLRGHQLDGFNAALKSGDAAKAHQELQTACARAEGIVPFVSASGSPPPGRKWWSGIWMTDELLIAVAKEEGWKPETACAARDAAAWLNANGKTVVEAENDPSSAMGLETKV